MVEVSPKAENEICLVIIVIIRLKKNHPKEFPLMFFHSIYFLCHPSRNGFLVIKTESVLLLIIPEYAPMKGGGKKWTKLQAVSQILSCNTKKKSTVAGLLSFQMNNMPKEKPI